ncbi:hypothetical protein J4439_00545 [Candidatus Woesearchaeota archaeon]|nr:hypothetical protein [Candidatus Woesearchaeota archaeon]
MAIEDTLAEGMERRQREHRAKELLQELSSSGNFLSRGSKTHVDLYVKPDQDVLERATSIVLQGWRTGALDAQAALDRSGTIERLFKPARHHALETDLERVNGLYSLVRESLPELAKGPVYVEGHFIQPAVLAVSLTLDLNARLTFQVSAYVDDFLPSYELAKGLAAQADTEDFPVRITRGSWPDADQVRWRVQHWAMDGKNSWIPELFGLFYVAPAVKD